MSEQAERCENCRFFNQEEEGNALGECRRRSPYLLSVEEDENSPIGAWPIVAAEEWCGEFQPKDNQKKQCPTNAPELVANLNVEAIQKRLAELDGEREALLVLGRAAIRKRNASH